MHTLNAHENMPYNKSPGHTKRRISIDCLEMLDMAKQLTEAGLRLSLIHSLTKVGTLTLRGWWNDIHGAKPPNGKLPETVISFIDGKAAAQVLSAFVVSYKSKYGLQISPASLLAGWRSFNRLFSEKEDALDINAAYYAIRDVRARIVTMTKCNACRRSFIYDTASRHTGACPFCEAKIN